MDYPTDNLLLDSLPRAERERLLATALHRKLPLGMTLYEQDGRMEVVVFLTSGLASNVLTLPDGANGESSIVGPAEMVGLPRWLGDNTSHTYTNMQIGGDGYVLPMADFLASAERCPALQLSLRRQAAHTIRSLAQTTVCNTEHEASHRLARWLHSVQVRVRTDEIGLTQEFLALMLGVRRPTVTLEALKLKEKGIIDYRRARICISDTAGLVLASCGCGTTIDAPYEPLPA